MLLSPKRSYTIFEITNLEHPKLGANEHDAARLQSKLLRKGLTTILQFLAVFLFHKAEL